MPKLPLPPGADRSQSHRLPGAEGAMGGAAVSGVEGLNLDVDSLPARSMITCSS